MSIKAVLRPLRVPVKPDLGSIGFYTASLAEPSAFQLETMEYTFPLVRQERRLDPYLFTTDAFHDFLRYSLQEFRYQCEDIVKENTFVNGCRVVDFGGSLPRLKIERQIVN